MRSLRGRVAVLVVTLLVAVLIGGRAVSDATSELAEARGFARERVLPLIDHMSAVRSALAAESALSTATVARETRALAALTEQRGATDAVLATTSATLSGEDAAAWDLVATRPPQIEQSLDGLEASLARLRADVDRVATLATPPSAGDADGIEAEADDVDEARERLEADVSSAWAQALAGTDDAVASMRRVQALTFGLLLLVIVGIAVFLRALGRGSGGPTLAVDGPHGDGHRPRGARRAARRRRTDRDPQHGPQRRGHAPPTRRRGARVAEGQRGVA